MKRFLVCLVALVFAIVMGLVVARVVDLSRENERMVGDLSALGAQLDELGVEPDVEIEPPAGERGNQGEQGERGLPGRDGRDATPDQIAASVAAWLGLNPPVDQPDPDDPEIQDGEVNDPEFQDDEIQDLEVDDPEVQDPEVDDPDPNGTACPDGYSLQPDIIRGEEVLVCTRDPEPAP